MSARDYTEREKAASVALHARGLVLFPRDTAGLSVPPLYVLLAFSDEGRLYEGRRFGSIDEVEAFVADLRSGGDAEDAARYAISAITMRGKPVRTTPYVGQAVHYVSHGTPVRDDGSQVYPSVCRAATVTETLFKPGEGHGSYRHNEVGLCVLNPTGQFFNQAVRYDPGTYKGGERQSSLAGGPLPLITCADLEFAPGSWHFIPEGP